MKPINRRHITLSLLAGSVSTGLLGGCSTTMPGQTNPFTQFSNMRANSKAEKAKKLAREVRLSKLSITHPEREKELNEIWQNVALHTEAITMSDNRVQIRASGNLFSGENHSEQNFFTRAAAETLRKGKDGFVIKQIDFFKEGTPWASWGSNLNLSSRSWIGNYEDFRANRNEQNIFSSRRSIRNKGLDAVILLLDKEDFPNRDRFTASEIYLNLLNHKSK